MMIKERREWFIPIPVPLIVLQNQNLHEDSRSFQNLEDYPRRILPIQVKTRRSRAISGISNITVSQESENPRKNISWRSRRVPAKEGSKRPRRWRGSADPTPLDVGFCFRFRHVFSRLFNTPVGPETTHPIYYQGDKDVEKRDNN